MHVSGVGGSALRESAARMAGIVPEAGIAHQNPGSLPGGRGDASGTGSSNGSPVGPAGGARHHRGPRFDSVVQAGGYAWWYLDAISDDGLNAIVVIGFIGSVFSPYYAWSGWRNPYNHCAVNVALYGPRANRWAMTERSQAALTQESDRLRVGPSALMWERDGLTVHVDEMANPLPRRLRGRIRLEPACLPETAFPLDPAGRHQWQPISPAARVTVDFDDPALRWKGHGYFDTNWGTEPLEQAFVGWNWSRAATSHGAVILYDAVTRAGNETSLALTLGSDGTMSTFAPPKLAPLPDTLWRVGRTTRSDDGTARLVRTFEDAPFYSRSQVEVMLCGERVQQMHECLSLERFANPIVRLMLPFRMPRRW